MQLLALGIRLQDPISGRRDEGGLGKEQPFEHDTTGCDALRCALDLNSASSVFITENYSLQSECI